MQRASRQQQQLWYVALWRLCCTWWVLWCSWLGGWCSWAAGSSPAQSASEDACKHPPHEPSVEQIQKPEHLFPQVFISHTGQDDAARKFACSILARQLRAANMPVYVDYDSLEPGDRWPEELMNAAANSKVVVAVLSPAYVYRFWCMLELDLALHGCKSSSAAQQGQVQLQQPLVIPVFAEGPGEEMDEARLTRFWQLALLSPEEAKQRQHQREQQQLSPELQKLLCKYQLRLPPKRKQWIQPEQWAQNIMTVRHAEIQNLRPQNFTGKDAESQMADAVVRRVVHEMPVQAALPDELFGVKEQQKELLQQLESKQGLWLYAEGGAGKTTMAELLFNCLAPGFQHTAMIELQLGEGDKQAAQRLKEALTSLNAEFNAGSSSSMLPKHLSHFVASHRVLLVLDNVSDYTQLDALLPKNFKPGSKIIITSRYRTLDGFTAPQQFDNMFHFQRLKMLQHPHDQQLFEHYAGTQQLPAELQQLQRDIVQRCGGMPLALRLIAAKLSRSRENNKWSKDKWQAMLNLLPKGGGLPKLQGIVDDSLLKMPLPQQGMFLDVATVLRGQPKAAAQAVWTAWHGDEAIFFLDELRDCCLIDVDKAGNLQMHDVIAQLGRGILLNCTWGSNSTKGPHYGSRVWVEQGAEKLLSLKGFQRDISPVAVSLEGLNDLPDKLDLSSCKILLAGDCGLPSKLMGGNQSLPSANGAAGELLWLECWSTDSADWIRHATQLVVLATSQDEVHNHVANMLQLRYLELSNSRLNELQLQQQWLELKRLSLVGCGALSSLELTAPARPKEAVLEQLCLGGCSSLVQLPHAVGVMLKLRHLDLYGCRSMCHLPDEITCLQQLTVLDLRDSTRLQSLPEQLGNMSALQELLLRNCNSLERLPSISQLSKLRVIDLLLCDSLQALPSVDLAQLTALTSVGVACCRVLQQLPPWVLEALPVSQQALKLNELQQITQVPEQLQRLTALTSLDLSGCLRLSQLPDSVNNLTSLQALYLSRISIAVLPEGFTRLAALQYLDLSNCSELVQLPAELGRLANLAYLDLANCSELQQLPDSFSMLQLAYLNLPEHFGPQPNSLMTSSQPLEAGAADAVHAAVTRDQSTWGTVTACNANLRYEVQGDDAEDVCSIAHTLLLGYAKKGYSHQDARDQFARDLTAEMFNRSRGTGAAAVICCCVPYTLKGDKEHVRKCNVTIQVTGMPATRLFLFKAVELKLSYDVLTIPEQRSPLMFERNGDGGWINWAVTGFFKRGEGRFNHIVFFPDMEACSTLLGSYRHAAR